MRALAAVGLARIDDPRAVDALVQTIDELQDPLHYPYTAAVYGSRRSASRPSPPSSPLLNADDPNTRRRAQVILSRPSPGPRAGTTPSGPTTSAHTARSRPLVGARSRAADHRRRPVVEDRPLQQRRVLDEDRNDVIDPEPVGGQPELLVALVAPDQRVRRVAASRSASDAEFVL